MYISKNFQYICHSTVEHCLLEVLAYFVAVDEMNI
jgi:hypothetical protein